MDVNAEILSVIAENQKHYEGNQYGALRHSLLQSHVMRMMDDATTLEESKAIYATYRAIVYDTPI